MKFNKTFDYRVIHSYCSTFEMSDFYEEDLITLKKEPAITILKDGKSIDFWDNTKYLERMFIALKEDSLSVEVEELIGFCKENNWDFKEIKSILIEMYDKALKIGML